MQPERGSKPQREGGRQNRRRPGGREKQAEVAGGSGEAGHHRGGGSRGRGGRGGGHGRRDARGRGAAAPPSASQCDQSAAVDLELQEQEKEQGSFSKRKIVSNWHRYEDTEKETQNDSSESQRGTDFSVLLSSAGDSFTQFRFTEEKEWTAENLSPKQLSGLYVDCQSLVQALEELPLHLKLNVAAELVQDATPVALPQIKQKSNTIPTRGSGPLEQPMGQNRVALSPYPAEDFVTHLMLPNKDGLGISSEAPQKSPSVSYQETDDLDEDLDLLLKLDAPVNPGNNLALEMTSHDTAAGDDLNMSHEKNDPGLQLMPFGTQPSNFPSEFREELDGTEEVHSASQQQEVTSKNITEEELEDWLDSMIS